MLSGQAANAVTKNLHQRKYYPVAVWDSTGSGGPLGQANHTLYAAPKTKLLPDAEWTAVSSRPALTLATPLDIA
jgi:hypothetical protein